MNVGLYFGTFNPIHIGHLIISNYMADYTDLDEVWLVVSPQNPLKKKKSLLEDYHRLAIVRVAIEDNENLRESDIEFNMPRPSYTSDTLAYLKDKHPKNNFHLIMGEDNLRTLHKWKNFENILENHKLYVYPRVLTVQEEQEVEQIGSLPENELQNHKNVIMCDDAPVMKVSSSFVRQAIKDKKDVRYILTEPVYHYIDQMNFYK
ncbi:nicotinate (nicotinamide) nucleotide adenylyltransferase [Brumimicrobium aurantiacum]|uniref:Probable nicotinate-nucleotide adenylyltransferase n=1 Tax=Brumimicrobium aurantiacum TaxID=1737063 RepID=A0A3E1F160_9FLAO|nr:nicotinate (nicotinamide) nucleotide adenylyltransferase [Brumimicrobium aurantiacum]RFC55467.1 nicotinate-nucleotide adenylyltransferase [Brumimicrobium aurantiacum]